MICLSAQMPAYLSFGYVINKRNGKLCSCATIELWMHGRGFLSTQEAGVAPGYASSSSYVSFVLSNLSRASIVVAFTIS